jgi:O-antigen/teichoic acid export membrane protein
LSLAVNTAKSAVWMLLGKIVATVVGIVGTIVVINLLDRGANGKIEYGEAMAAYIVVATASQITTLGIGQFVVVKAAKRPDLAFHATTIHVVLGVIAMIAVYAARAPVGEWVGAPNMGRFVAGLAVAFMFDRLSLTPERVLMRSLSFRIVAISRTLGDLVYVGVTVGFAASGAGGMSIVFGNIARSGTRALILISSAERKDWFEPTRLRIRSVLEIWRFSGPIWVGAIAAFACRRWDNLLVSRFYGADVMGSYNVAYNLAENPPIVAEQAIDVLLPSYAAMDAEQRTRGFIRSLSLLSFITSPLVLGLGVVAPTVVAAFLGPDRSDVAPMLTILAAMSVSRPLVWASAAYFQATDRPRLIMILELGNLVLLVAAITTLGQLDVLWACAAVGTVALVRAVVTALVLRRIDGTPLWTFFGPQLKPVFACIPMCAAVIGARHLVAGIAMAPVSRLGVEVVVGAIAYIASAWVLAKPTFRDVLGLARKAVRRRRAS